jgi:phenylpropionate dioxygenase-like ring-hydroxylating dioxygenase large terminal subunit
MSDDAAPIAPDLLRAVVAPNLGESRTLPAVAYTSAEVFAWEQRRLFEDGWVCLGRAEDLAAPGAQRAFRVGGEGVLVVRGDDGVLRGFYNTCRHRGHELLDPGATRTLRGIKCPYHAWVYRLDGALGATPRFGRSEAFDAAAYPLIHAPVEEWRGWVFANGSGEGPDLSGALGTLEELIEPWEPERLVAAAAHVYEIAANWKTIAENHLGRSHSPSIHPALSAVTQQGYGEGVAHDGHWLGRWMRLADGAETLSVSGASGGVPIRGLDADRRRRVYQIGLFPNLLLSLHPDYVVVHRLEPQAPGHTRIECQWLFPPEAWERQGFDPSYASEFWDITNREDRLACGSVQRGLSSAGSRPGPFASSEDEVRAFMAMVARAYLDGHVSAAPQVRASRDART